MNASPDRAIIEEVAQLKGISEAFVEKDWFVTQVIKRMADIRFQEFTLVFTGGTALSKAHKLIQRFSEDIDFKILAPELLAQSRNQQGKTLAAFKKRVVDRLRMDFTVDADQIEARNENRAIRIELNYPTLFDRSGALRPHILLELTVSTISFPAIRLPVSSFVHEMAQQAPEVGDIACTNPIENAADKLSALAWRIPDRVRGRYDDDPALVRHLHDLSLLAERAKDHPDFPTVVKLAIQRDDSRSETVNGLSVTEKFTKLLHILTSDPEYQTEYAHFVNGMSYAPMDSTPTFDVCVQRIQTLINHVLT